jgi:hypothetical protein
VIAVTSILFNFVRMFKRGHEDNVKQVELEKKKAEKDAKDAERERSKASPARNDSETVIRQLKARVG